MIKQKHDKQLPHLKNGGPFFGSGRLGYNAIAQAIDQVGAENSEFFLAQLALLLANPLDDNELVLKCVAEASASQCNAEKNAECLFSQKSRQIKFRLVTKNQILRADQIDQPGQRNTLKAVMFTCFTHDH